MNNKLEFVELDAARDRKGLRLVLISEVPSPWSEAAIDIFTWKRIPFVPIRYRRQDDAVRQWTGVHNAPVAVYNDEVPLSHWGDLLALAERLEPRYPLLPTTTVERAPMLGLCHEILGAWGLVWHTRLLVLDVSFHTGGQCGFPVPLAEALGKKYGYGVCSREESQRRVNEILRHLAEQLQATGDALRGGELTALDIYTAAALGVMAPLPDSERPLNPKMRHMFESAAAVLQWEIPDSLMKHRSGVRQALASPPSP